MHNFSSLVLRKNRALTVGVKETNSEREKALRVCGVRLEKPENYL